MPLLYIAWMLVAMHRVSVSREVVLVAGCWFLVVAMSNMLMVDVLSGGGFGLGIPGAVTRGRGLARTNKYIRKDVDSLARSVCNIWTQHHL